MPQNFTINSSISMKIGIIHVLWQLTYADAKKKMMDILVLLKLIVISMSMKK